MGASAAGTPSSPDGRPYPELRASDAERDAVAARLRDEYVAGRLSHDTFVHRMDAVLGSRRRADLPPLVADLPARSPAGLGPLAGWLRGAFSRLAGPRERAAVRRGPAAAQAMVRAATAQPAAPCSPAPMALRFPRGGNGEFSIGRDSGCDLAIADLSVSRRHATLERSPDGWLISDLASTNGTRVNGWRVRGKVTVRPGDLISFGSTEAVFVRDDQDAARDDQEIRKDPIPPASW